MVLENYYMILGLNRYGFRKLLYDFKTQQVWF